VVFFIVFCVHESCKMEDMVLLGDQSLRYYVVVMVLISLLVLS
jgi:hypothetical protein